MIEITAELLSHHDKPGPRYTSYPTAIEFTESFGHQDYEERLAAASRRPDAPLSLYVHLPFCESRCSFCACHVVVSRHPEVADAYLRHLVSEAGLLASRLGDRRTVTQYHWGGGTPTFHSPDTLVSLHAAIAEHIDLTDDAEVSIEADPRVTTTEHLEALTSVGFSRISFGVQDLDPEVQRLIGRNQTREQTIDLYEQARRLGFSSINLDLIYGLPGQDEQTLGHTLDEVLELRPDRLAVYSFAFVPWMRPHQRRLDEELLPGTDEKFELLALVVSRLTSAGYTHIGMDHFALPDDELTLAAAEGTLTRTFMGYTTKRDTEMIALGTSGISDVDGSYAQNHRRLASYYEGIAAGRLPIERGYRLDDDDRLRRFVITELMCNGVVDLSAAVERFEMGQREDFKREIAELTAAGGLVDEGLATLNSSVVEATELGMLFIRRIATIFDAHRNRRPTDRPMFSKTV